MTANHPIRAIRIRLVASFPWFIARMSHIEASSAIHQWAPAMKILVGLSATLT
jgi:hypothetical protein